MSSAGAKVSDYPIDDELNRNEESDDVASAEDAKSSLKSESIGSNGSGGSQNGERVIDEKIGNITFVSCATGSSTASPSTSLPKDVEGMLALSDVLVTLLFLL